MLTPCGRASVDVLDPLRPVRTPSLATHRALRQMGPHGVLTGALERQGPSTFPRPDCAGGCGSSMGTNPGRTHRFCAPLPRLNYTMSDSLNERVSVCRHWQGLVLCLQMQPRLGAPRHRRALCAPWVHSHCR